LGKMAVLFNSRNFLWRLSNILLLFRKNEIFKRLDMPNNLMSSLRRENPRDFVFFQVVGTLTPAISLNRL